MPRITHVKAAQQRYEMIPVIDPVTGKQATTVAHRTRPTKRGKTESVVRRTQPDKTRPLPPYNCGSCGKPIEFGTPYKSIAVKRTYGGITYRRHESCPDWHVWEYSDSLSAQQAQIGFNAANDLAGVESEDDVQGVLDSTAEAVREIAEAKRESASNIEDGFGHSTSTSDELNDIADELDSHADTIETLTIPDYPDAEAEELDEDELAEAVETWKEEVSNLISEIEEWPV